MLPLKNVLNIGLRRDILYNSVIMWWLLDPAAFLRAPENGKYEKALADADIGHIPPQIQIVNGAIGRVEFADGKATITKTTELHRKPQLS